MKTQNNIAMVAILSLMLISCDKENRTKQNRTVIQNSEDLAEFIPADPNQKQTAMVSNSKKTLRQDIRVERAPQFLLDDILLHPKSIGVIYNVQDSDSIKIAQYYQKTWDIPDAHMIRLDFTPSNTISRSNFRDLYKQIQNKTADEIVGYAIAWIRPFRSSCMSITSAVALGPDFNKFCDETDNGGACRGGVSIDSYDFNIKNQAMSLDGLKPSMMINTGNVEDSLRLIDRGYESRKIGPVKAKQFLVYDNVVRSNVRRTQMERLEEVGSYAPYLSIDYRIRQNGDEYRINNETDVMFYFTGATRAFEIDTNTYLPGAVADHVTSFGGRVVGNNSQMPITEWIQAGLTGSYGTVVEPCAITSKFPNVEIMTENYLSGMPLLWAYWSSVRAPAEGLFLGDPLAKPYKQANDLEISRNGLSTKMFLRESVELFEAPTSNGPWKAVADFVITAPGFVDIEYADVKMGHFYKLDKRRIIGDFIEKVAIQSESGIVGEKIIASNEENPQIRTPFTEITGLTITPRTESCFDQISLTINGKTTEFTCDNCEEGNMDHKIIRFEKPATGINSINLDLECRLSPGLTVRQYPGDFDGNSRLTEDDLNVYLQILEVAQTQDIFFPILDLNVNQILDNGDHSILEELIDEEKNDKPKGR